MITPKPGYMVDPNNPNGVVKIPDANTPPPVTGGAQPGAKVENQGKPGYDVFGNPVAPAAPAAPTVGSIYSGIGGDSSDSLATAEAARLAAAKTASETPIDENQIRAQTLASFQAEIDAQNALYADKLAAAKVTGANRLGSSTAIQARRGLIGSDFGAAQTDTVNEYNAAIEDSINNEKAAAISSILSKARTNATDEIAAKTKAKQEGLDSYIKYLSEGATRKSDNAKKVAQLLIAQGHTLDDLKPEEKTALLNGYGVSLDDVTIAYKAAKDAQTKAEQDSQFTLSKGQTKFDAKGNVIATGTKDLPPSAQEYEYAVANGYKGTYDQYQTDDTNRKIVIAKAGSNSANGFTPYQTFQATQNLKKQVQTSTAAAQELKRQTNIINDTYKRLDSGEAKDLNGTSQAIITTFNKLLDPSSVVRESEYDRSASGQALLSTIGGKVAALVQGGPGLTKASLKELVDLGNLYAKNAQKSIDAQNARARDEAEFFGLNPDFVTSLGLTGSDEPAPKPDATDFADIESSITIDGTKAYIPRSVWDTLGTRKDALLAEAKADGYELLIK